jgi:hypothetical protein
MSKHTTTDEQLVRNALAAFAVLVAVGRGHNNLHGVAMTCTQNRSKL